jgi:hypothetical protein
MKMRLFVGAGLSVLDLVTDLVMIYTYATEGEPGTAMSLGVMVGLSVVFQLFVAYSSRRSVSRRAVLREMLVVLSGLAPGVHAMRVASGEEQGRGVSLTPEMEMTIIKGIEIVFESIPGETCREGETRLVADPPVLARSGTILQVFALLQAATMSKRALTSILVSSLTTGFGAATISFE